jgi:hypothetical protein
MKLSKPEKGKDIMSGCERIPPNVHDAIPSERGEDGTIGSLREVIHILYPHISIGIQDQAASLLEFIQKPCDEVHNSGAKLFLRGSAGKRVIYWNETGLPKPPGWESPEMIWKSLLKDQPEDGGKTYGFHTLTDRHPELDITYQIKSHDGFPTMKRRIEEVVKTLQLPVSVDFITYANVRLANIVWPGRALTVQIHPFPSFSDWNKECRVAGYFVASEAFTGAFIKDKNVLLDSYQQIGIFDKDAVLGSFRSAEPAQAFVGFERSRINQMWYGGNTPQDYIVGGNPVDFYFARQDFWKNVRKEALRHPERLTKRHDEIAVNNLLLLTMDPHVLFEKRNELYWKHFPISGAGLREDMFLDSSGYKRIFQDGTIYPEQSGPAVIMKEMGLSNPAELMPFVTPRLV